MDEIRQILNSQAGKSLRDYLLARLNELKNIDSLVEKDTPTHQSIELKAQKRAYLKLKEILGEIMTLSEEKKAKDPRDSYHVE